MHLSAEVTSSGCPSLKLRARGLAPWAQSVSLCSPKMLRVHVWLSREFTIAIFPPDPSIIKHCLQRFANLGFFQDNTISCHILAQLGVGKAWPPGLGGGMWCDSCSSAGTVPRGAWGCRGGCGPGELEAVLEGRTSIMLRKTLGWNGCLEPAEIFYKVPGHETLFLSLLPYVFPAGPPPVFCSPESSHSFSPRVFHWLFWGLLEVPAGVLATWKIKLSELVDEGLKLGVPAFKGCAFGSLVI